MAPADSPPAKVNIMKPKVDLRAKAPEIGDSLDDLIAKADAAVAEMAEAYPARVEEELSELIVHINEAVAAIGEPQQERLSKVYGYAHDFKGQGGSFGYDLISRIGASICRLLYDKDTIKQVEADLLMAHYNAFRAVIANDLKGDGGKIGDQLAGELEAAARKFMKEGAE